MVFIVLIVGRNYELAKWHKDFVCYFEHICLGVVVVSELEDWIPPQYNTAFMYVESFFGQLLSNA